jgi:anti-sigma factor RsiW
VAHDETLVTAYLWGDLAGDAAERFERHLVDCDDCWAAVVEDGHGRAAVEALRELASPVLRDRVRFAIEAEKGPVTRKASRRFRRAAASLVLILISGAVMSGVEAVGGGTHRSDPGSVAAVVHLAGAGAGPEAAPVTRLTVGRQSIVVTRLDVSGTPVLVARSDRPFPVGSGATPMLRDDSPWVASRGQLNLVCVNRPHPVLLAARMPVDQLIGLAAHLAQ